MFNPYILQEVQQQRMKIIYPWNSVLRTLWIWLIILAISIVIFFSLTNLTFFTRIAYAAGFLLLGYFIFSNYSILVPDKYVALLKILGAPRQGIVLSPGRHYIIPFLESVIEVPVEEKSLNIKLDALTNEKFIRININLVVYWLVSNPLQAFYATNILNNESVMTDKIKSLIRSFLVQERELNPKHGMEFIFSVNNFESEIKNRIRSFLNEEGRNWGIVITDIALINVEPTSKAILDKFEEQLTNNVEIQNAKNNAEVLATKIKVLMDAANINGQDATEYILDLKGKIERKETNINFDIPELNNALELLLFSIQKKQKK